MSHQPLILDQSGCNTSAPTPISLLKRSHSVLPALLPYLSTSFTYPFAVALRAQPHILLLMQRITSLYITL